MFAKKVAEAQPSDNAGLYFLAGQYPLVQVDTIKLITSQKPGRVGAEMLVLQFDILDSKVAERPAGMRSVCQILNSNHPGAADDAKRFVQALYPSVSADTIDEAAIVALTSAEQPAHGRLLALECYVKRSEKTGKDFTKHLWREVPEALQAQAKELRAKAGLSN